MNYDQVTGILRAVLPAVVAWVVAKFGLPGTDWTGFDNALIVVLATVISSVWSIVNNRSGKIVPSTLSGK